MVERYVREMLDNILRALEEASPELREVRELCRPPIYHQLIERSVYRIVRDIENGELHAPWLWRDEYDRALRRQSAQLDRIESLLSENRIGCRFSEGRDGGPWFAELIAIKPSLDNYATPSAGNADADPESFTAGLKGILRKTTSLVLMDPYALAGEDDVGTESSAIDLIKEIVSIAHNPDLGPFHLHLYCRPDVIDYDEWEKLQKILKPHKLSVYVGDFHDRYILFSQDFPFNKNDPSSEWHEKKYWAGLAFGASLNGIRKRPTYVLSLKAQDIRPLISYIDGVVIAPSDHQTLKQAQEQRDAIKAQEARKKREEEKERMRKEIMAEMNANK